MQPHAATVTWRTRQRGVLLACARLGRLDLARSRVAEGVVAYGLALVVGQVVFLGWPGAALRPLAHAYWMFLFVAWAGMRLGLPGTAGLLCLVAAQAGWGALQGQGFFARDLQDSGGLGYGAFIAILALVGMALAFYLSALRRQQVDACIAAIAFECQEGLLITNAQGVILRANRSFLALSGYAEQEVLGRTPHFLCASAQADTAGERHPPWPALQRQEWHRRRSGERYPAWVTRTPVTGPQGQVTHYVMSLTDLSDWRRQQARRRQREQAHRQALVREVHHRIKNNLQGITGILQGLAQRHPQLGEPIAEVTGQVHSIAALHGLQGRGRNDQVLLGELVRDVAAGVAALWDVPVDLPAPAEDWLVHPDEAVPLALIVHELVLNAVKHGGRQHRDVRVEWLQPQGRQEACLVISNPGRWPAQEPQGAQVGLELVSALMPRSGASLALQQREQRAEARLCLQPPVLQRAHNGTKESHEPA